MEVLDTVVVSRVVDLSSGGKSRRLTLVSRIRALIREARAARPELAAYQLHDVGLKVRDGRLMVNLYFHR